MCPTAWWQTLGTKIDEKILLCFESIVKMNKNLPCGKYAIVFRTFVSAANICVMVFSYDENYQA